MKKTILMVLCIALLLSGCSVEPLDNPDAEKIVLDNFLKGAWICSVYNITYPTSPTTNSNTLKREIDTLITKAQEAKLNALFFQVRPCADALYKSNIFPWSKYLTGTQGLAPNNSFDPLEYIIEKCHSVGIELHAWINPLRITTLTSDSLPSWINPSLTINVNNKFYFNPDELDARELIIKGVKEIIENYDADGIHFDDYFYPEGIIDEDGGLSAEQRRNNIDELIRQTYLTVKSLKPYVAFGVSPSGIWANKSSNPLGSNTRGFESYYEIYGDSRGWVKKGWVDYIAPQIYWYIGQPNCDFEIVLDWWADVCRDTNTQLYVGLAGYKQDDTWTNNNEMLNQTAKTLEKSDGFIIFSFNDLQKKNVSKAIET